MIPAKAPLIEIKYVDYNGPDYCSENGIKARLNQLGWEASRRLIDIYGSEATAVGRYAAAQSDFDARLDDSDGFVSTICEFDTNAALVHTANELDSCGQNEWAPRATLGMFLAVVNGRQSYSTKLSRPFAGSNRSQKKSWR